MKTLRLAMLLLAVAVVSSMACAAVKVGTVIPVEEKWQWVTIANPDGISNGNGYFAFGEIAGIDNFGTIKLIAIDGNRVLLEYNTTRKAFGTECPNGTIFFLEKAEFTRRVANYEKKIRQERAQEARMKVEKARVRALLKSK